jgi:hypothetical protein
MQIARIIEDYGGGGHKELNKPSLAPDQFPANHIIRLHFDIFQLISVRLSKGTDNINVSTASYHPE